MAATPEEIKQTLEAIAKEADHSDQPRVLPIVNGYSLDWRLQEFRKVWWNKGVANMKTVPFNSVEGAKLLAVYLKGK
jgi:hypothetical protein